MAKFPGSAAAQAQAGLLLGEIGLEPCGSVETVLCFELIVDI